MQKTRRARLESVIREELSVLISRELKDPRISPLTITEVKVSSDGSVATIFITLLGTLQPAEAVSEEEAEKQQEEQKEAIKQTLNGLQSAKGFMRRHLAKALTVRNVPDLVFKEDKGLANASRVYDLLKQISSGQ